MALIVTTRRGINFKGETLNEDTLKAGELVVYRNKLYITGNRRHNQVELFGLTDMRLKYVANCNSIRCAKNRIT